MNDKLWEQAEKLAARSYQIDFSKESLSTENELVVYMARVKEMPACKGFGDTVDEAQENIWEIMVDYIYALLEEGLPVPEPTLSEIGTSLSQTVLQQSATLITFSFSEVIKDTADNATNQASIQYQYSPEKHK